MMKHKSLRALGRLKRKQRIRSHIFGTTETPRLSVFKSTKHLYAQIVDDTKRTTVASASTIDKELKGKVKATVEGAKTVGKSLAKKALQKGVKRVLFDRNGFLYHGQLKALATAAREEGLKF